jgi:non-ribosomal peptide synthetase component E (peptide arylation enzyme)
VIQVKYLDGYTPYRQEDAEKYEKLRWWSGLTLGGLLDKAADIYPDKEAFVDGRTRLTFSQAREKADRLAIGLMDLGVKPMDRVLVQLPNWTDFVPGYFALQKIGAIPVLLITRYRQFEIASLAELSGATGWLIPEQQGKYDFVPIIEDVLKHRPQLKHVAVARGEGRTKHPTFEQLMAAGHLNEANLARLDERRPHPDQVAHMGPTGGSTGLPKLVPRSHNMLICSSEYAAKAWDFNQTDTCLLAGPLGHDLTFTKGLIGGLFVYAKSIFQGSTKMADICAVIEREKVTSLVWVPTLGRRLVSFEGLADYDLSTLKKMHCGGGASAPDLIKAVNEKLDCAYYNAYGGSEGQTTITRSGDTPKTIETTVGKPTCPYDTYKVVDPKGNRLPPGASGELLIKGPGIFTGYYNNPGENEKAFDKDGFFKTGDVAKISEDGYITLTGRIKEMVNRGGESISAVEIENLIVDHPEVAMVAVVPMPDPDMGEKVCAYIQPESGCCLDFDQIIDFLKECQASVLQLPERIEFVECMPFTKAEKIDKMHLRKDIVEKIKCECES